MDFLSTLKLTKFKFVIRATQPLWLPAYKGSTFRGAFGVTFKRIVCVTQPDTCETCQIKDQCVYYSVFESPNPGTLPELESPKVPHPFVLEPPLEQQEQFPPGSTLTFNLILVGNAIHYLPYFIYTFDSLGKTGGIGKGRREGQGRFQLLEVCDDFDAARQIYNGQTQMMTGDFKVLTAAGLTAQLPDRPMSRLTLQFETPTRIKHQGKYVLLNNSISLNFQLLIENLYRRLFCLAFFHGEPANEHFAMPHAAGVTVAQNRLKWQDWERYSHRQRTRMKLGGFVGNITYTGELAPWLPLIKAGEVLHVGKATAFGLGKYRTFIK